MDRLEISAKEKEAPDLTLEVRAGNTPAINLYKSYGFQAEAVRKNYYQNPVEDALIMWRRSVPSIPDVYKRQPRLCTASSYSSTKV